MSPFIYKADIIPVSFFVSIFFMDVGVYFFEFQGLFLLIYFIITFAIKSFICAWNHHHQHCQTFSSPLLNRLLEIVYGFQSGIVGYGWVLHHNLWHHSNYQDQTKDESAWKSPTWKTYNVFMYTWVVTITSYLRAWVVWNKYKHIQKYFLTMCIIQLFLLIWLIAYKPFYWILLFLIPMVSGLVITVFTTYFHHAGIESDDHYRSSYNIINPWYNLFTWNLGYHTAHHLRWSLHWSQLPKLHKEIEAKIEPKYFKKAFWFDYIFFK